MSHSPAPIFVNASFTVLGGTLQRATRVPLKYVDNGDGMKIPMLGVRKRDYWMFGPFLPNKMTEAIREAVAAAIKNLQARFRIVVMEKRKERLQVELDKECDFNMFLKKVPCSRKSNTTPPISPTSNTFSKHFH